MNASILDALHYRFMCLENWQNAKINNKLSFIMLSYKTKKFSGLFVKKLPKNSEPAKPSSKSVRPREIGASS